MRGAEQYQRRAAGGAPLPVTEDGLTYLVDLESYLDTGLFLDQRETRRLIRRLAGGRRFLNLFAYTSTATVCADRRRRPLDHLRRPVGDVPPVVPSQPRGERGHRRGPRARARRGARARTRGKRRGRGSGRPAGVAHRLVQADCLRWIAEAEGQYDLIFLDPPSFSNSKRMGGATFDVQRDHPDLIRMTARRLLAPHGILLFSSNRRGFKLDPAAFPALTLKDLSRATLAPDFARRANAHHVWRIEAR